MELHIVLLGFFVCSLLLLQNGVLGSNWKLSKAEDFELERQLKLLNKPAMKTIRTENGDIYDCIEFYQQPAFDHPLLKNNSFHFEMESTSLHNKTGDQVSSKFIPKISSSGKRCPNKTVLIKRVTKEDLIRQKLALKFRPHATSDNSLFHYAVSRTKVSSNRYAGAAAYIGKYNPQVTGRQYSAGRLMLRNGPDSIQVGWRVDPFLHGDNRTHFFIRTDARDSHCYNLLCPGFVLTTTDDVIGRALDRITYPGQVVIALQLDINRDPYSGNWKLRAGRYDRHEIGYWPKNIFSDAGLTELASYIDWGGEVLGEPHIPSPPMGLGTFPVPNTGNSAIIQKMTYRDEHNQKIDADDVEPFADSEDYKAINVTHTILLYGGPGGNVTN